MVAVRVTHLRPLPVSLLSLVLRACLVGAIAGCGAHAPVSDPLPTLVVGTVAGGASASPTSTLAVVPVHVTYVLRSLRPSLDVLFPTRDSLAQNACNTARGLICHQYVYRRDSLAIRAQGDRMLVDTRLAYRAQIGAVGVINRLASCGYEPETMRRALLSMSTSLYWRRDWRIGARNTQLNATLVDQCLVSIFGMNATTTLRDLLNRQLADFAAQADTAIPSAANLKPLADSLWKSFLEPTPLDSLGTLWLMLDPEAVRVTPLVGAGQSFRTAIVLYARPRVVSGARPRAVSRPLPPLMLGEAPPRFDMPVTIELPFAEIERRASALLAAETARQGVQVDSVHVRAVADTVHVGLDVSGSLRGRLSLVSRLRWDADSRELRLDDLDWSMESRGVLSRAKATLGAPLIGRAVRRATMGGRVALGAQLDSVRAELMRKLNGPVSPGVALGSSVTDVQIIEVTSTGSAFVVRARILGQANVYFQ